MGSQNPFDSRSAVKHPTAQKHNRSLRNKAQEPGAPEQRSVLPIVKLKPSMLKVALRHFLNPCFLDVGCVIVYGSALFLRVDEGEVVSLEKPDADCRNLGNPAGPPI